jgi:hypothetical protein
MFSELADLKVGHYMGVETKKQIPPSCCGKRVC